MSHDGVILRIEEAYARAGRPCGLQGEGHRIAGSTSIRVSAGIVLFRRYGGKLEVLLGHPGGPYFARKDADAWSIPKGEPDPGEDLYAAARREFAEETGHAAPLGAAIELGAITQKGGKVVHAWAIEGDLDPATARSNEFEMVWPPGSGQIRSFPELDRLGWFAPDDARFRVKSAQIPLLDRLVVALADR